MTDISLDAPPMKFFCINDIALSTIDGLLRQKFQAEELSQLHTLQKKRNSLKGKWTPNTTGGDDGIRIMIGLQDHDIWGRQEKRAKEDEKQKKNHCTSRRHSTNLML